MSFAACFHSLLCHIPQAQRERKLQEKKKAQSGGGGGFWSWITGRGAAVPGTGAVKESTGLSGMPHAAGVKCTPLTAYNYSTVVQWKSSINLIPIHM